MKITKPMLTILEKCFANESSPAIRYPTQLHRFKRSPPKVVKLCIEAGLIVLVEHKEQTRLGEFVTRGYRLTPRGMMEWCRHSGEAMP